jgi:hypothetical protein
MRAHAASKDIRAETPRLDGLMPKQSMVGVNRIFKAMRCRAARA